jgi:hypothetical protein
MESQLFSDHSNNRWWPVFIYPLIVLGCFVVCIIPLLVFFFDLFQDGGEAYATSSKQNPWFEILNQIVSLGAALMASWLTISKLEESSFPFFGLTIKTKPLLIGFLLGLINILTFSITVQVLGWVDFSFSQKSIIILTDIVLFFFVACAEEILIRGYLLIKLKSKIGNVSALLITSILFGLIHYSNDHFTWIGFANISLSGYLMGLLVLKTNTISTAIGLHWSWNLIQGSVFGFSVSGHSSDGFFVPQLLSSQQFTGGAFGAEGSIFLIPLTSMLIYLLYRHPRLLLIK